MSNEINSDQIKELIKAVDMSRLSEFELQSDKFIIKMKKAQDIIQGQVNGNTHTEGPHYKTTLESTNGLYEENKDLGGNIVVSPLVGTFYRSPSPDKPEFIKLGEKVKQGSPLCIIEAMKIMNEICSEYTGDVVEILAKDGEMVEYGQPLFRIE